MLLRPLLLSCLIFPAVSLPLLAQDAAAADSSEEAAQEIAAEAEPAEGEDSTPAEPYHFQVPEGWSAGEGLPAQTVLLSPAEGEEDDFRENLNVLVVEDVPEGTTAKTALDETLPGMSGVLTEFSEVSREAIEVANESAERLRYQAKVEGVAMDNDLVVLVRGGRAYVITCSMLQGESRAKYEGVMRELVGSLSFGDGHTGDAENAEVEAEAVAADAEAADAEAESEVEAESADEAAEAEVAPSEAAESTAEAPVEAETEAVEAEDAPQG